MLSTVILTKNSEKDIARCLESVSFSNEVIVIDDNSTDRTVFLAQKYGAIVFKHSLNKDFAKQRNFALEKTKGDWVLFVDSDEVVSPELKSEIITSTGNQTGKYQGFYLRRQDTIWGREIKHGENGSLSLLRLGKKDAGIWRGKVHEEWIIKGQTSQLQHILQHYPHPTFTEFLEEINWYTTLRADELFEKKVRVHWYDSILYPKVKFFQNYIFKLGFLDGTVGFILAIMMSFHSYLVRGKLWQLQNKK